MKNKIKLILAFIILLLPILGCGGSVAVSTAKIKEAYLTSNSDGTGNTSVFSPDQIFYCIVKVANAPEDTTLKAVWTAVDVEGADPNFSLDEVEITTETNDTFTFNLSNQGPWPVGKYKVEIFLNGKLDQTLEFQVQS